MDGSQANKPIAWMNSAHIESYAAGEPSGIAWASYEQTEFYTVPLYTDHLPAAAQPPFKPEAVAAAQRAIMANPFYYSKFGDNPVAAFGLANSALKAIAAQPPAAPVETGTKAEMLDLAAEFEGEAKAHGAMGEKGEKAKCLRAAYALRCLADQFDAHPQSCSTVTESDLAAKLRETHQQQLALWKAIAGGPEPRCRDCADFDGRCQGDGLPCDPQERALERIKLLRTLPQAPLKPIGDEPKDGTPFLGYLGGLKVPFFVCWWGTSIKTGEPYICILGIGELWDHKLFPTHWAPLPDASTLSRPQGK